MSDRNISSYDEWILPDISVDYGVVKPKQTSRSRLPTAEEIQNVYKQSYDEGFNKGYEDGKKSSQGKVEEYNALFSNIINILDEPLSRISEQVIDNIKELSLVIAGQIIRRELTVDPNNIVATIQRSIDLLNNVSYRIEIYLNPGDISVAQELLSINSSKNIILTEDPSITRGGCRVKSESSTIDATIEEQLKIISYDLLGGSRSDDVE